MSTTTPKREQADVELADGVEGGGVTRRRVLGGLATLPVLYGIGSADPALAATAPRPRRVPSGNVTKGTADLVRGAERRYNAPLLTPGTRLVLPAGIRAVPIQNYYRRPRLAPASSAWPHLTATDGTRVDASIIPNRGAATRIAMLSGFTAGWYELIHASGRADRVTWDTRKYPFLWLYGEFGATADPPFHDRFFTLALQPFSRNPYTRNSQAH